MKANVPESALPTQMAADNRLTTIYTTHVLFPKLGPLATQRYTRLYARLLKDLAGAVELVNSAREFATRFGKPVAIPAPPPPGNAADFRFEPVLKGGNRYLTAYVAGLVQFASARIVEGRESEQQLAASPLVKAAAAKKSARAGAAAAVTAAGPSPFEQQIRFDAGGVWPPEVKALLRDEPSLTVTPRGRLKIDPIGPHQLLARREAALRGKEWGKPGKRPVERETIGNEVADAAEGYALAQILHGIAQPNVVLQDLLEAGAINAAGPWLGNALNTAADPPVRIASVLVGLTGGAADARELGLRPLITQAAVLLRDIGITGSSLLDRLGNEAALRLNVNRYLAWRVDRFGAIDPSLVPLPDDTVIVGSREWAFRRTERLSIGVGTPTLRGPFATEAVAPKSKSVTSESSLQEVVAFQEQGSGRSTARSTESATFNSATFRQALSHMTEEGINSENAFAQDTTLFDTLRERRREAIDRTLTQISSHNEQRSGVISRTVTSTARSYTTRGKDEKFATTEVSFQVAAPVDVQVRLEDVGLVWCPRMRAPFLALHRLIADYEDQARQEYLTQNQIIDPVRPPEVTESASFKKEIGVRGNTGYQVVGYLMEIPAQYQGWELDAAATKVDFRNGTSNDYNWNETWNLDDLESWHAWIRTISRVGNVVTAIAVLETGDPELLNRGFLTFDIAMKRMTDDGRAALEAYDADKKEAAAQRQAVEVRANQYARMRRDELIEQYESSYELQEEAFAQLVKQVFQSGNPDHVSYWREILRSCVEWSNAGMRFEPGNMNALAFPHLPPSHFMNAQGVRFLLPVLRSAETAFFDALERGAGSYHQSAAQSVRTFIDGYRTRVDELKVADPNALILDSYRSEMVLGRHLEAVLSQHPFAEPT